MKNTFKILISVILALLLFVGCSRSYQPEVIATKDDEPVDIIAASDIHYLASSLHDNGELFTKMMDAGDGKMTAHCEEIVDSFVDTVIDKKPSCLVISGDLTFNGELESLKELKSKLIRVQKAGVPVLVIPGNHDISYPLAYGYKGDTHYEVEDISDEVFKEEMADFGYNQAVSTDETTFSYEYAISDTLHLIFLDANTTACPFSLSSATMEWLESRLQNAQDNHIKVVTVTHQNVLAQNELLSSGYVLNNHFTVESKLKKYGVGLNISGHSHIQNMVERDGLADICVGSMTVGSLPYDSITIFPGGEFRYEIQGVSDYNDEAREYFYKVNRAKLVEGFKELDVPDDIAKDMIEFALDVNYEVFSGTLTDEKKNEFREKEAYSLWKEYGGGSFWSTYLEHTLK